MPLEGVIIAIRDIACFEISIRDIWVWNRDTATLKFRWIQADWNSDIPFSFNWNFDTSVALMAGNNVHHSTYFEKIAGLPSPIYFHYLTLLLPLCTALKLWNFDTPSEKNSIFDTTWMGNFDTNLFSKNLRDIAENEIPISDIGPPPYRALLLYRLRVGE